MDNYKLDLLNMKRIKLEGVTRGIKKYEYINLFKLDKEIKETRVIRYNLIKLFESDCNQAIQSLNIDYLSKVPFPMVINYLDFIQNGIMKINLLTRERRGDICLINKDLVIDIEKETEEVLEMLEVIKPYLNGLFRVLEEEKFLDRTFYQDLVVSLYNRYLNKLIINGNGVTLGDFKLDNNKKLELERLYYKNLKSILKNISIVDSLELDKYRTSKSKKKILEIYRG